MEQNQILINTQQSANIVDLPKHIIQVKAKSRIKLKVQEVISSMANQSTIFIVGIHHTINKALTVLNIYKRKNESEKNPLQFTTKLIISNSQLDDSIPQEITKLIQQNRQFIIVKLEKINDQIKK